LNNDAGWTDDTAADAAQADATQALSDAATAQSTADTNASKIFTDASGKLVSTPSPTTSGLYLGSNYLGFYDGSSWSTYMANNGNFYLSGSGLHSLSWVSDVLTITGSINILNPTTAFNGGKLDTSDLDNDEGWTDDTAANAAQSTADTNATKIFTDASGKITGTPSLSSSGLYLGSSYMGYYNGSAWKTYMANNGNFYLSGSGSHSLSWVSDVLTITGTINILNPGDIDTADLNNDAGWTDDTAADAAQADATQALSDAATAQSTANTNATKIFTDSSGRITGTPSLSSSGLYLGSTYMGYYDGSNWKTYMSNTGNFYLSGGAGSAHSLSWNGTTLDIVGEITASSGEIGGWAINESSLSSASNTVYLYDDGRIQIDNNGYGNEGIFIGLNSNVASMSLSDELSTQYLKWDGTKLTWKALSSELDSSGNLTVSNATVSGDITATTLTLSGAIKGDLSINPFLFDHNHALVFPFNKHYRSTRGNDPDYSNNLRIIENQGKWNGGLVVGEGTTNLYGTGTVGSDQKITFYNGTSASNAWNEYAGETATVTSGQEDPYGGTDAYKITSDGVGTSVLKYYTSYGVSVNGTSYTHSVWVRNLDQSNNLQVNSNGGGYQNVSYSNGWTRVVISQVGDGVAHLQLQFRTVNAGTGVNCIAYEPQLEAKDHATPFTSDSRTNAYFAMSENYIGEDSGTIAMWINTMDATPDDYGALFDYWDDTVTSYIRLGYYDIYNPQKIRFLIVNNGTSCFAIDTNLDSNGFDSWSKYLVVARWDGSNEEAYLDVYSEDGALIDSVSDITWSTSFPTITRSDEKIYFGSSCSKTQYSNALIDNLLVLDYVATDAEVETWYYQAQEFHVTDEHIVKAGGKVIIDDDGLHGLDSSDDEVLTITTDLGSTFNNAAGMYVGNYGSIALLDENDLYYTHLSAGKIEAWADWGMGANKIAPFHLNQNMTNEEGQYFGPDLDYINTALYVHTADEELTPADLTTSCQRPAAVFYAKGQGRVNADYVGIKAFADDDGSAYGVIGKARSNGGSGSFGYGGFFQATQSSGYNSTLIGVYGSASGNGTGAEWAGYFGAGNVRIDNNIDCNGSADIAVDLDVGGDLNVDDRITGGFGAISTSGTLNWNDSSNCIPGSGYSLLTADATNGPNTSSTAYYHPFTFEYGSTKDGGGNLTQFAIPYSSSAPISEGIYYRGRYSNSWSNWYRLVNEDSSGDVSITNDINVAGAYQQDGSDIINDSGEQTGSFKTRSTITFGSASGITAQNDTVTDDAFTVNGADNTMGYKMIRSGKVTGLSFQCRVTSATTTGNFKATVQKNGTNQSMTTSINPTSVSNDQGSYTTSNSFSFSAGDKINVELELAEIDNVSCTVEDIAIVVEILQ